MSCWVFNTLDTGGVLAKSIRHFFVYLKINNDKNSNQMSTPVIIDKSQDPLVQQVMQAVEKDPSLMQQLVTLLTPDESCSDPAVPLERSSDPLFYDSLKNGGKLLNSTTSFIA
jgi:hypothetical protein